MEIYLHSPPLTGKKNTTNLLIIFHTSTKGITITSKDIYDFKIFKELFNNEQFILLTVWLFYKNFIY